MHPLKQLKALTVHMKTVSRQHWITSLFPDLFHSAQLIQNNLNYHIHWLFHEFIQNI